MGDIEISRRRLLLGGALVGGACASGAATLRDGALGAPPQTIIGIVPWREGTADVPPMAAGTDYRFFSAAEQAFIEPAIDRLIPADETGPSASAANVHVFLDRQLGGLFGRGDHFYLGGPVAERNARAGLSEPPLAGAALSSRHSRRSRPMSAASKAARTSRACRPAIRTPS